MTGAAFKIRSQVLQRMPDGSVALRVPELPREYNDRVTQLDQTLEELRARRIEQAKKLLAETNHKIELVALHSGYQSANSFCVAFKHSEKVSPKTYRRSVRPGRE